MRTAEEQMLADAIRCYQPFSLAVAICRVLYIIGGDYVPVEKLRLQRYAATISIDTVPDSYMSLDEVPLLGIRLPELFE